MMRRPSGAWILLAAAASCAAPGLERREYERPAMGTTFRVVLYAEDRDDAEAAAEAAFARIEQLERRLSDWDPSSEVRRLTTRTVMWCGIPGVHEAGDDLWRVLVAGQEMAARTGGAFDVTVGPYVRLWRRAARQRELPAPDRLAAAAFSVGHFRLKLIGERTVELRGPGMQVDLGGIAKGFALDEALQVLAADGYSRALVDGGGDVAVGAPPPGREAWSVVIDSGGTGATATVGLARGAVATSGDAYRFVEIDGVRYSHIVDPRTGQALTTRTAATVIAPDGMTADALASALCVMGAEDGLALVETLPDVEARVVVEGLTFDSTGFAARLRCDAERTNP
jgi:thiamine biosynthesis lipoprotein